jgi:hypothetical protein
VLLVFTVKYGFFGYSMAFFHVCSTRIFTFVFEGAGEKEMPVDLRQPGSGYEVS